QALADFLRRQELEAAAHDFVEDIDRAALRVGAHDRERASHRQRAVALQVHEGTRHRAARAVGCLQAQHELMTIERLVGQDFGVLCKDRSPMRHGACKFREMVESTAMRTATPFMTCCWMTDCGPSATSLVISTSRFIGPGCMTIASLFAL